MNDKDDAKTLDWCVICRRTSNIKWKKHVFTKYHQQQAVEFFIKRIKALQDAFQQIYEKSPKEKNSSWKCVFCQVTRYMKILYVVKRAL
jgi:hypothetical protein